MRKELETNINSLELKIAKASKTVSKNLGDIFLIAVSKKKNIEHIRTAQNLGINNFGENYAQELEEKANNIDGNVCWHFIGPLQSNKAKIISKYADWIHTIDRKKIADKINEECKKINKIINACIQVNISNESTKSGINPENLMDFAKYVDSMENINLKGIMVLPSLGENNKKQMQDSKLLHEELVSVFPHAEYLSMGTTNDFETAIVSGSNMIRVGELIFGKR
jgi:pyridoxal phosphate enzyme (YggS family)